MANESAQGGGQQGFGAWTFCQFEMFINFLLGQIVLLLNRTARGQNDNLINLHIDKVTFIHWQVDKMLS
jgi:hypothetical protein